MSSTARLDSSSAIVWEKLGNRYEDYVFKASSPIIEASPELILSLPILFFCRLSQAHAGAAAILVDELDASIF
jgi:hypothetical protein